MKIDNSMKFFVGDTAATKILLGSTLVWPLSLGKNNKITYTSTDGNIVTPYKTDVFGANIISNEYEGGIGVITFDGDVTTIGESAFVGMYGNLKETDSFRLTSITIPDSVTSIGNSAFVFCDNLTSVNIPDSVTSIGNWAFKDCDNLTSVTIGNSVTTIGEGAFVYCHSLKEFKGKFAADNGRCLIIDGVLNTFAIGCGVTQYTIPDSVTSIGDSAFCECASLTSVTIGNSVTMIGEGAFYDCSNLTSVTIPDSVTTIGSFAFADCESLKEFKGKFAADGGRCLIMDGVLNAFAIGCGVTQYTIPDSVTSIGYRAFYRCDSLTSVTIGDSVTTIGDGAFYYCGNLTSVYCKATTPPALGGASAFDLNLHSRKFYVPRESVNVYSNTKYWNGYAGVFVGYDFNQ